MQTPFPPVILPAGPQLLYPISPVPPYDAGKAVRVAARMDAGYVDGGAWYDNWGDFGRVFTHDLPNEFTNPGSNLRSGQFFDRVSGVVNNPLVDMGAMYAGPEATAGLAAARTGLRGFRALTGLGRGGARERGNVKATGYDRMQEAIENAALDRRFARQAANRAAARVQPRTAVRSTHVHVQRQ